MTTITWINEPDSLVRYVANRVTDATSEPVTSQNLLDHMRLTNTGDATLTAMITAGRQWAEGFMGRAVMNQTWNLVIDGSPPDTINLPYPPLNSVTSITAYTDTGASTAVATANYSVLTNREPGRVMLHEGQSWPTSTRAYDSIIIQYVAGVTATASVAQNIKTAILIIATHFYEHRGDEVQAMDIPMVAKMLLAPYRQLGF